MKNIFVVNTPYHLLTSFILTHSIFKDDENFLVLMHSHGYDKWKDSKVMTYMSSSNCGYRNIFLLLNWLSSKNKQESYKRQAQYVKDNIKPLNVDNVFIAVDISPVNQLFVEAVGKNVFYRYEDGIYSYFNDDRRRKKSHAVFHKCKVYLLKLFADIEGNMYINTEAEGENPAGKADYMYKPWLLHRKSPQVKEITVEMINEAMQNLKDNKLLKDMFLENSILYLSQPMVEKGIFSLEEEADCLKKIVDLLGENGTIYYKPHPNDNPAKIEYYKKNFSRLKIFNNIEPAEIFFYLDSNLKAIISYQSSALMNVDKFSKGKIKSISLADIFNTPVSSIFKDIMKKAGVFFPQNIREIKEVLLEK